MQRSRINLNWLRGGQKPGAAHQKHVSMLPMIYLYRFPHVPHNPGPVVMKYYWTLGCVPTGLASPFRLQEFLNEYQAAHVPEEVEQWLRAFVQDPVDSLQSNLHHFMIAVDQLPNAIRGAKYQTQLPMITSALPQLEALQKDLGVEVPAICLRGVAGSRTLRGRLLDDLYDYGQCLQEEGSTPHRRAMRALMEDNANQQQVSGIPAADLFFPNVGQSQITSSNSVEGRPTQTDSSPQTLATPETALQQSLSVVDGAIASAFAVDPRVTANDERAIIRLLTTFGEGAMRAQKYDAAATVLQSALTFAFDDECKSTAHGNLSTALNRAGQFKAAEQNAKEAVLLTRSKKGFCNLGVALAYQHRENEALSVMNDALQIYQDDEALKQTQAQILSFASQRPIAPTLPAATVGAASSRYYSNTSRVNVMGNGVANFFGNQFDSVAFHGKKINAKLDPTNFGQTFGRAHVTGLAYRTSTKTFERN